MVHLFYEYSLVGCKFLLRLLISPTQDTFVKHLGRAMKSTEDEVFISGDDTQRSWRDWVASQFNSYAAKIGGLQGINLVAGTTSRLGSFFCKVFSFFLC